MNQDAEALLTHGRAEEAAAAITRGQLLQARLLAAPRPTLAAMEAVSDLDDLYARLSRSNGHIGWARLLFQKNLARWKVWKPQNEESLRRYRQAQAGIADCDRRLSQ